MEDSTGQIGAALEASGELSHALSPAIGEPEAGQKFCDPLGTMAAGDSLQAGVMPQVLFHGEHIVKGWRLENNPDA